MLSADNVANSETLFIDMYINVQLKNAHKLEYLITPFSDFLGF